MKVKFEEEYSLEVDQNKTWTLYIDQFPFRIKILDGDISGQAAAARFVLTQEQLKNLSSDESKALAVLSAQYLKPPTGNGAP